MEARCHTDVQIVCSTWVMALSFDMSLHFFFEKKFQQAFFFEKSFFAPLWFAENFTKTSFVSFVSIFCLAILSVNRYKDERVLFCWFILHDRPWLSRRKNNTTSSDESLVSNKDEGCGEV